MRIEVVSQKSSHLATVKVLGKANAKTLGLFPEGAFDDYAGKESILGAIDSKGECVGYVLYRVTRNIAYIAHLCVSGAHRGRGVARQLANALFERTRSCQGVSLKCRQEYAANKMWPKLGFDAVRTVNGRGKSGTKLVQWWKDQTSPPLFSSTDQKREHHVLGVMDSNVFFDLFADESGRPESIESKALLEDWLSESIELAITPELTKELGRCPDPTGRAVSIEDLEQFRELNADDARFDAILNELKTMYPQSHTPNDESDLRHLAWAIAGGAAYFLTRDSEMCARSDAVEQKFSTIILRPGNLIVDLDEVRRTTEYQPARLAGSLLKIRRLQADDDEKFAHIFHKAPGEPKHELLTLLRATMARSQEGSANVVLDRNGNPLSIFCIDRTTDTFRVPVIRVRNSPLAPTVFRQVLWQILQRSAHCGAEFVHVTDRYLDEFAPSVFEEFGFFEDDGWQKLNMLGMKTLQEAAEWMRSSSRFVDSEGTSEWARFFEDPAIYSDAATMSEQERLLWPGKLADADIPTYIVSIRPKWAHSLFDSRLADQTLFGRDDRMALNTEGVYYTSSRVGIEFPARILWYVSADENFQGVMALRACSTISRVVIGKPKELYRQFKRLGVWEWADVFDAAGGQIDAEITAIQFGWTELFKNTIPREEVLSILRAEDGKGTTFLCPTRISSRAFARYYRHANPGEKS